jgi:hypothetical protein
MVTSGGATVSSNGLMITSGGLTVTHNGILVSTSGVTISGSGLMVSGGLTINSAGLRITAGGLMSSGGLTVHDSGLVVSGGLTINNLGLKITSGGLMSSGGLTVHDIGLVVSGGLTINNAGLKVTGGLTVMSGGAFITGGMTITGAVMISSTIVFFSDRRLKTNIMPIDNALNKVSKLNGVYFKWIKDEPSGLTFDNDRHVGVLAQDVQQVLPEVVQQFHKGKYLGVDYPSLIPLIIEAIHELDDLSLQGKLSSKEKEANVRELIGHLQKALVAMQMDISDLQQWRVQVEQQGLLLNSTM